MMIITATVVNNSHNDVNDDDDGEKLILNHELDRKCNYEIRNQIYIFCKNSTHAIPLEFCFINKQDLPPNSY